MKKTKIEFKDIKAGDMLEIVSTEYGVKAVMTGIAFEKVGTKGNEDWQTAQGGLIAAGFSDEDIYRIDVTPVKFDDVQAGDKLTVTTKTGNVTTIVEDVALTKVNESLSPFWVGKDGHVILFKHVYDSVQTIEIERG